MTLKPRLARSCLKTFLDPSKPFGAHYGAIIGIHAVGGAEAMRVLVLPNVPTYGNLLKDGMADDSARRPEAERVLEGLLSVLATLREGRIALANGDSGIVTDDVRQRLNNAVGEFIGSKISELGQVQLAHAILDA